MSPREHRGGDGAAGDTGSASRAGSSGEMLQDLMRKQSMSRPGPSVQGGRQDGKGRVCKQRGPETRKNQEMT